MFYLKLAANNIKKSFSNFAPFILASTVMFVMNFIIASILFSPSLAKMKQGAQATQTLMGLGLVIISAFAVVILIYSYRFLLKQRTKEFGLYEILGLSKSQIAHVSFDELIMLFLFTLVVGTAIGLILGKFLFLIFVNLIGGDYFNLEFSTTAFFVVSTVFLAIFILLIFISTVTISRNSSLGLLKDESRGEREPKANFIFALLSIVLLGYGYYMAVSVKNPIEALTKFFIAVLLVIVGTYLFYLSFTIWLLKKQKANKNYYYQPKHFITVSSMLYRMKQNAVGLANITVLVAMTFVTLATTVGLYTGVKDVVKQAYPDDTTVQINAGGAFTKEKVAQAVADSNINADLKLSYNEANLLANPTKTDKTIDFNANGNAATKNSFAYLVLLKRDDLVAMGEKIPELADNEVLVATKTGSKDLNNIKLFGKDYKVKENVNDLGKVATEMGGVETYNIVVNNEKTYTSLLDEYNKTSQDGFQVNSILKNFYVVDEKDEQAFIKSIQSSSEKVEADDEGSSIYGSSKHETETAMKEFTGSFLFIGFTLGITFILGAALIIYYKQVSEGAQDKRNYKILQEVGLSKKEVASTIKSQIMMVFFMPIALAVVHFGFAYIMIRKLIELFGVTNGQLILTVSISTIAGVAFIYFLIYKLTSRVYYNIVERP